MDVNSTASLEAIPLHQLQEESGAGAKYRLIGELGRGGMSDVFLALMSGAAGFTKLVVIKRLEPLLARDAEFLSMFLDEARLAARLNHPERGSNARGGIRPRSLLHCDGVPRWAALESDPAQSVPQRRHGSIRSNPRSCAMR